MGARTVGVGLASVGVAAWLAGAPAREKALWPSEPLAGSRAATSADAVRALESAVAGGRGEPNAVRALAQLYVDACEPGLAVALMERSPVPVRDDVRVRHALGRALLDEGRSEEALRVERTVLASCLPVAEALPGAAGCDPLLLASARRRVDILAELVSLGIDDADAHPEETRIAYLNATREARVTTQ